MACEYCNVVLGCTVFTNYMSLGVLPVSVISLGADLAKGSVNADRYLSGDSIRADGSGARAVMGCGTRRYV